MSQYGDDLIFDGVNGVSGGAFVRNIRQQVLSRGIHDDDRLIALTAASFFDGDALEWYESLTEETQESWKLLRRAFLARWPTSQVPATTSSPAAPAPPPASAKSVATTPAAVPSSRHSLPPTPAAAPPPTTAAPVLAPAPPAKSTTPTFPSGPIRAYIRVYLLSENTPFGYVSRFPDKEGDLNTTMYFSEALVVLVDCSHDPHGVKIQSNGIPNEWLGLVLDDTDSEQKLAGDLVGATMLPMRLASDYDAYAGVVYAPSVHHGSRRASVWNILMDGSVQATWKASQTVFHRLWPLVMTDRTKEDFGGVIFFSGYDSSLENHQAFRERSLKGVRMMLEPV